MDNETNLELMQLERERREGKQMISDYQSKMSLSLLGDMGEDITEVINGRRTVDVGIKKTVLFKIKCFFLRLLNAL